MVSKKKIEYNTKYSKKYIKLYPERNRAKVRVCTALKLGLITKPKVCSLCGKEKRLNAHHNDYIKKLEVIWLCHSCHKRLYLGYIKLNK